VRLTTQQSYALFEKYRAYVGEICDECGKGVDAVRFTRRGESGVWCSRGCRGDAHRAVLVKPGRPRKYKNGDERRAAKTQQQRNYRLRLGVEKTVRSQCETKDLKAQKTPLSPIPLTWSTSPVETGRSEKRGGRV
jgi:hypothetical protein